MAIYILYVCVLRCAEEMNRDHDVQIIIIIMCQYIRIVVNRFLPIRGCTIKYRSLCYYYARLGRGCKCAFIVVYLHAFTITYICIIYLYKSTASSCGCSARAHCKVISLLLISVWCFRSRCHPRRVSIMSACIL